MFGKDLTSFGLLSATLVCLAGVPVAAIAAPSPKEEPLLQGATSVPIASLAESIHRTAATSEPKPQFVLADGMEVSHTSLSEAATQEQGAIAPVSPATTVSPLDQPASQETRVLDRDRSISTEAVKLGIVTPTFTFAQGTNPNLTTAQAGDAATPRSAKGPYISLSGGYQGRQRSGETADTFTDFKGGYIFNGALGYRFGNFRTDVEASFWNNDVEAVSAAPTGRRPGSGNVTGRAIMFNAYYDVHIRNSPIKPYLGAGIGFYNTRIHDLTNDILASVPAAFGGPLVVQDSKSNEVFAFQVRAGLAYAVSQNVDLFLGYRYFGGNTLTFTNTTFGTLKPSGAKFNSVEFGIRILF